MLFDPHNFLTHIKTLVMGGGRHTDGTAFVDSGFLKDSDDLIGSSVLGTGVTYIADSDGFGVLSTAATNTGTVNVNWRVPRDYDEATDRFFIRFAAKMGGATDTPTLTPTVKKRAVGGAASSLTANSGSPTAALSTTAQEFEIEYRGQGLTRGQQINITIASGAHGTDALQFQALGVTYYSTLVSYNELSSTGGNLRG
jgi:hypothetical protein